MKLWRRVALFVAYMLTLGIICTTVVHRFGYWRGLIVLFAFAALHEASSAHPVFTRKRAVH